jgi:hypothetical protein
MFRKGLEEKEKFLGLLNVGNEGERHVNNILLNKGYIPYSADNKTKQPFDKFVLTQDLKMFLIEVKHKTRLRMGGFGIPEEEYKGYLEVSKKLNIPLYLVFVEKITLNSYYIPIETPPEFKVKTKYNNIMYVWKNMGDFENGFVFT